MGIGIRVALDLLPATCVELERLRADYHNAKSSPARRECLLSAIRILHEAEPCLDAGEAVDAANEALETAPYTVRADDGAKVLAETEVYGWRVTLRRCPAESLGGYAVRTKWAGQGWRGPLQGCWCEDEDQARFAWAEATGGEELPSDVFELDAAL